MRLGRGNKSSEAAAPFGASVCPHKHTVSLHSFCVCSVDRQWTWHLEQLRTLVPPPPPVTVVSDRSNGICCGVPGCFKNAAQTLKMAICALLHPLRPTMKAPGAPDVATVPTDATADTTVVVRRGRGKPLSNCERIRMLQALLAVSQRRRQVAPWRYCCCCSQVWNV
jgi:hypothetical protein